MMENFVSILDRRILVRVEEKLKFLSELLSKVGIFE
jgi:hypothetical protein